MSTFFFPPPPQVANAAQPYAKNLLTPTTLAVRVDQPPASAEARQQQYQTIIDMIQPPWLYHFLGHNGLVGGPYMPPRGAPDLIGQRVDNPPYSAESRQQPMLTIGDLWQPNPWVYSYNAPGQPYGQRLQLNPTITNVRVDNPPFTYQAEISDAMSLIIMWQPPPPWEFMGGPQMLTPRKLSPFFTAVRVDNPPFSTRRVNFWSISAAWEQPPPLPTLKRAYAVTVVPVTYSFGTVIV